jgi:hypothetical protein
LVALAGVIPSGKNARVRLHRESSEPDQDHPTRRQAWFMAGRTAVPGQNAAELRSRAFQQRLQMRNAGVKLNRSFPVPFGPPTPPPAWTSLGPSNLASDTTGGQSYGPVTGRATSVAIDQGDTTGNTVYIGGAFGGVWKSTNGQAGAGSVTWTPVLETPTLQITDAIGAIAVQPGTTGSTAVVLVGTGEPNSSADSYYGQGLLRSTNGGGTWTLISADSLNNTFKGLGFSKIAFSTKNTSQVVAATASTDFGFSETVAQANAITRGPYFSTDGGATWTVACVTDQSLPCTRGVNSIFPGSTTEVVFNPSQGTNGTFYALIRAHGMYQSTDGGANWTRLANQPQGATLMNTTNCPSATSNLNTCPLYRGHIAVRVVDSTHSEMYVAYVDINETLAGVFRSLDGGGTWSPSLGTTGYATPCGTNGEPGCGTTQATYNMYLNAIANSGTDLYLGGINIYRCHLASTSATSCTWSNLTHVYGCSPTIAAASHVHPDQHGMDFLASNPNIMYFANDGGIYGTQNGANVDGTCTATNANSWQNLNGTLGPMTEFVSFSQDITNSAIVFGGTQDNGSPGSDGSGNWNDVNNGDGGFNDIDPTNANIWYTSNTDVSVQRCAPTITRPLATSCRAADFPLIVDNIPTAQGGNNNLPDKSSFYTPFMLDPRDPTKVIIGTCRVWRGSSSNPAAWPGAANANALSFNLVTGDATACTSGNVMISALAAGGPPAPSGSSAVIYAGREDGRIFVSTAAESGQSSFVERSIAAATGGCPGSGASATGGCKISSISVDPEVTTGATAVATVMGFGVGHVWRTIDGGMNWTNIDNGLLPDSPANSVIVDPFDSTHIFVGNDIGVFETQNTGTSWAEVGTGFPAVPATRLLLFDGNNTRHLRASTYGRGIWDVTMAAVGAFFSFQAPSGLSQTIAAGQTATYNLTLSSNNSFAGAVTFTCSGAPGGSTCTVNGGNALNLTAGQTNAPFTVTVTNTTNAGVTPNGLRGWPMAFAAILAGLLIGVARKPKRAFPMALAVLLLGGLISCGGGNGGGGTPTPTPTPTPKPNTNATLTVTGTGNSLSRSISLSLTVTH